MFLTSKTPCLGIAIATLVAGAVGCQPVAMASGTQSGIDFHVPELRDIDIILFPRNRQNNQEMPSQQPERLNDSESGEGSGLSIPQTHPNNKPETLPPVPQPPSVATPSPSPQLEPFSRPLPSSQPKALKMASDATETVSPAPDSINREPTPIPAAEMPKDIPNWAYEPRYRKPTLPDKWSAVVPWGQAITLGAEPKTLEIKYMNLSCDLHGQGRVILTDGDGSEVQGGYFLRNPYFGGDNTSTPADISRKKQPDGTTVAKVTVLPDKIFHWWIDRSSVPHGANNCMATAVVRGEGVAVGVAADWWKDLGAQWSGPGGNNTELGMGALYRADGWTEVKMVPMP